MWTVYNAEGGIVPGLADRNEIRDSINGTGNNGGVRVKHDECD